MGVTQSPKATQVETAGASSFGENGFRVAAMMVPVLAVVAAFVPSLEGGFLWDDHALIEEHSQVHSLANAPSFFTQQFWADPLKPGRTFYRPLVTLTYAIDWTIWGGAPGGFHATNLALHTAVVLLLAWLCRIAGAHPWSAAALATLFGTAPRLTESVAWIAGRTDVLAALFSFSAMAWALGGYRGRKIGPPLLLFLALLCKEVAFAPWLGLVVYVIAWDGPPSDRIARRAGRAWPFFVALSAYAALRVWVASGNPSEAATEGLTWAQRLAAALAALGHYVWMLFDLLRPNLQIGDRLHPEPAFVALGVVTSISFAALIAWGLSRRRHPSRHFWVGMISAAMAIALVMHLLPLDINVIAADRYLYVPWAMLLFALAPAMRRLQGRRLAAVNAALLTAGTLATLACRARMPVWTHEHLFWKTALVERAPTNLRPLQGFADVLLEAGLPERALPLLREMARTGRSQFDVAVHNNLAVALDKSGQREEAISIFETIVKQRPEVWRARLNLVMALARAGRWTESREVLSAAESRAPNLEVLQQVRELLERVERQEQALGPPGRDATASTLAAIALLRGELNDPLGASRAWAALLQRPDATSEQRTRALGFLAQHGDVGIARSALEAARSGGAVPAAVFSELELALRAREDLQ
jgi:tetratricopeptide (TPR) repeat protein